MSASSVLLFVCLGMGACITALLLLYNAVAAILFAREPTDGSSSGLARAAWAVGLLSLFSWWMPCAGVALAVLAIGLARVERGRIYRDESTLAGATPVRMGSVDGGVAFLLQILWLAGLVASWIAARA